MTPTEGVPRYLKEWSLPHTRSKTPAETREDFGKVTDATEKDATQDTCDGGVAVVSTHQVRVANARAGLSLNGRFRSRIVTRQASEGGGDLRSVAARLQRHSLPISKGYHQQPYRRKVLSDCRF
jgi:hypothetical protein